ncbi:hypothetical protein SSX86_010455 [Deinandra increscens subsp. villosa]|uniref:Uncharacterized protein n=1 Tax=Deinandra increscens subsp. villosa TaxID=3103831 RepID=A0AAP0D8Z8_9ASTR
MARSISSAKLLSSFVVDQISVASRRKYATGNVSGSLRGSGVAMRKNGGEEPKVSNPWVPDPVTGYYKPEDQSNQADQADRRDMLLKQKNHGQ